MTSLPQSPAARRLLKMAGQSLEHLRKRIISCRACPRLVAWREKVAREKRAAFLGEDYWGQPVPGFGDPAARLVVVGLAPAAHGGNRTGRVFTGDRSGDWLYAALHRAGYANQPTSVHRGDGLHLTDCYVAACVRCAPPGNKPTPQERDACLRFLADELHLLPRAQAILCLGSFAWDGTLRALRALGHVPQRRPAFGHGTQTVVGPFVLVGSYHPSQRNTFTGRLTEEMIDVVLNQAKDVSCSS